MNNYMFKVANYRFIFTLVDNDDGTPKYVVLLTAFKKNNLKACTTCYQVSRTLPLLKQHLEYLSCYNKKGVTIKTHRRKQKFAVTSISGLPPDVINIINYIIPHF